MERREFLSGTTLLFGGPMLGLLGARAAGAFTGYSAVAESLFQGINRVEEPSAKTLLEKKHAPVIDVPASVRSGEVFLVKVQVGEVLHPMESDHYIQHVEVLAGNEPACRVQFTPAFTAPVATIALRLDKPVTLVVREYCNLHGLWESRLDVSPS